MTGLLIALLLAQAPGRTTVCDPNNSKLCALVDGTGALKVGATVNVGGTTDTVGSTQALNALNATASVALQGEAGAGFHLAAGTLTGTLTPELSVDNGTSWIATKFIDTSGTTSATQAVSNPNGTLDIGIVVLGGARQARVRVSAFTSGTANAFLVSTVVSSASASGGGGGTVTQGNAGSLAQSWFTQITDATTGPVAVKAASTAAGASDKSLVVALSPNSPIPAGSAVIGHVIADSGSTTAVTQATASNLNAQVQGAAASGAAKAGNPVQGGAVFNTTQPTVTTGQAVEIQATARGAQIVAVGVDGFSVTANAGTNLNTSALALDASVTALEVAQASTTSGQKGILEMGAVTTAAPSYTTAQTSPFSLSTAGGLRMDITQVGDNTILTGNGTTGTGSLRVTIASDNTAFGVKPTDGTNTITVKAASTAAAAADTALVVTEREPGCAGKLLTSTTFTAINVASSAGVTLITGTSSQKVHICQINMVAAAAVNVALVEGTGTVCATGTAGMAGGTTAGTGYNWAANSGIAMGDGFHVLFRTATNADNVCLLLSGNVQVSGSVVWVSF